MIRPVNHRVLIQLIPPRSNIVIREDDVPPDCKVVVLAIAPDVTVCAVGDYILMLPDVNLIGIDKRTRTVMIHESNIMAITDDPEGVVNNN